MPMPARRRAEIARGWREIGGRSVRLGRSSRAFISGMISARAEVDGVPRVEHGHAGHVPPAEHPPVVVVIAGLRCACGGSRARATPRQ